MKYLTLIRLLTEQIDTCDSFEVEGKNQDPTVTMHFYYKDPIDSITWIIDSGFFQTYLYNIIYTPQWKKN